MYKVGDKVKIRQWDDMEKEFGLNNWGSINCKNESFVTDMKKFCGKIVTINNVNANDGFNIKEDEECWRFTEEMIEKEVNKMKYINVKFVNDGPHEYHGDQYTYIDRLGCKVGDLVVVDTCYGYSVAKVLEVNINKPRLIPFKCVIDIIDNDTWRKNKIREKEVDIANQLYKAAIRQAEDLLKNYPEIRDMR